MNSEWLWIICACIEYCRLIMQWLALDSMGLAHIGCTSNKSWVTNPEIIQCSCYTVAVRPLSFCVCAARKWNGSHFLSYFQLSFPDCLRPPSSLPFSHTFYLSFSFFCGDKCVYSGIGVWTVVFVPSLSLAWHSLRHTKSQLITLRVSCLSRPEAGYMEKNKSAKESKKVWE